MAEHLMESATQTAPVSKARLWAGRVMSALVVLFLLFDSLIHMMQIDSVAESFAELGYPLSLALGLGILELVCIVLYVIPRTSILGAILLTGYLGGAVATSLRVGNPLFSHILFPVYVGVLVWGGLYWRDDRLRALIPLRRGLKSSKRRSIDEYRCFGKKDRSTCRFRCPLFDVIVGEGFSWSRSDRKLQAPKEKRKETRKRRSSGSSAPPIPSLERSLRSRFARCSRRRTSAPSSQQEERMLAQAAENAKR